MPVYIIKAHIQPVMFKVGKADDPIYRLKHLQIGSPAKLELVAVTFDEPERFLLRNLPGRAHGEWFYWSQAIQDIIDKTPKTIYSPACLESIEIPIISHSWKIRLRALQRSKWSRYLEEADKLAEKRGVARD